MRAVYGLQFTLQFTMVGSPAPCAWPVIGTRAPVLYFLPCEDCTVPSTAVVVRGR